MQMKSKQTKIGLWTAVVLAAGLAACGYFVGVDYYSPQSGVYDYSHVVVLRDTTNFVVLFRTPSTILVYNDNGGIVNGSVQNLGYSCTSVAPAPNRQFYCLSDSGTRVRRVTLGTGGGITGNVLLSSTLSTAAQDIAVNADGSRMYVIGQNEVHRLNIANASVITSQSLSAGRSGGAAVSSVRRLAFDRTQGKLLTAEAFRINPYPYTAVIRFSYWSPDLVYSSSWDIPTGGDSRGEIIDFDVDNDGLVVERSAGSDPNVLETWWGGVNTTPTDQEFVYYSSFSPAGTLSSAGVIANFGACGGAASGAYLWRARTNASSTMLQRFTVCP